MALAACDDDGNPIVTVPPTPTPTPTPTPPPSFAATFAAVAANQDDRVTVPDGYTVDVLLKAGGSVEAGTAYSGSFPASPAVAEKWAGGGHEIGRAHVCTPVTNAHLVCRLLL